MEHLSCWGDAWATENKAWSLGGNPVCPVYLNIICQATFPRPILGAPKADGSWGEIPWGLPRGRTQTIHLFSFQARAPQQDSALGQSKGVTLWGSWGGALFSPGLWAALVCGHTTTPPGWGRPSGLSPSPGGRLPCGQVLSRSAGAHLCLYCSLRRCYRSLRTEIKTCILQVQIYCT